MTHAMEVEVEVEVEVEAEAEVDPQMDMVARGIRGKRILKSIAIDQVKMEIPTVKIPKTRMAKGKQAYFQMSSLMCWRKLTAAAARAPLLFFRNCNLGAQ